ncbi:MAG TPA: 5'-nucleotidase C-terminal domain-containing protein [Bacteroides mediterraneensis]|uniref:bifunctional metallophosphatase/5'-nucleotidase n=1 Tax=Bacteroides mediterraneensis TaxID=1841856 RepID=UPI0026F01C62|nr:5'-nucleotidase C-terminal domain-containing protein [Bacteroides mediterraneensis]HJH64109.1 5'-nucleotidase C-terminal domain-containing protein [Bacteroides mediterraneensis]
MIRFLSDIRFIILFALLVVPFGQPAAQIVRDTLAIISLNDFHGSFVENNDIPGAGNVYSAINDLKKRYPANIVLSDGDNFGGSYFSVLTNGGLLPSYFSTLGIKYSAIGNHEFDNGQDFLSTLGRDTIHYLCSNIFYDDTEKLLSCAKPSALIEVMMPDGSIGKIGLIGLVEAEAKKQSKAQYVNNLIFSDAYEALLKRASDTLTAQGADFQVLLAHVGTAMGPDKRPQWTNTSVGKKLRSLPQAIKGIASGHSHQVVCGYMYDNIPVVQGGISGKYIGVLRFAYDRQSHTFKPVDPMVVKTGERPDDSAGRINIDNTLNKICSHTKIETIDLCLNDTLALVNDTIIHSRNDNKRQTMLGTYVCMAYADAYRRAKGLTDDVPVLAFSHFGSIRRSLYPGYATALTIGELLPFSNHLRVYMMKGKEIFKLIEAGIHNSFGCIQMNNLVVDTMYYENKTRVLNVYYNVPDRESIALSKNKFYPVVVDEYIANGGDNYPKALFPENEWDKTVSLDGTTEAFLKFMKKIYYDKKESLSSQSPYKARLKYYQNGY